MQPLADHPDKGAVPKVQLAVDECVHALRLKAPVEAHQCTHAEERCPHLEVVEGWLKVANYNYYYCRGLLPTAELLRCATTTTTTDRLPRRLLLRL